MHDDSVVRAVWPWAVAPVSDVVQSAAETSTDQEDLRVERRRNDAVSLVVDN
jgi:hypothetical protein